MRDNYRPISILPVICKIYETILYEQLTEHLENENILTDHQLVLDGSTRLRRLC